MRSEHGATKMYGAIDENVWSYTILYGATVVYGATVLYWSYVRSYGKYGATILHRPIGMYFYTNA